MAEYILAIDQGTTGTTALLVDHDLNIISKTNQEFPQYYPKPPSLQHDLNDIWNSVTHSIQKVIGQSGIKGTEIAAIGITNQRETTSLWDRKTEEPIARAIVWQCRRTESICEKLKKEKKEPIFQKKSGLLLDPYFSGTKIKWYLDEISGLRTKALKGEIAFGTIDSFLLYRLTAGSAHMTDPSNASRTLLMNLKSLQWDEELLKILSVPKQILPEIRSSTEIYGKTKNVPHLPDGIPISGIAGDQQAALFGQACFDAGEAKCTYGTGSFILLNTGPMIVHSKQRLLSTVAWKLNGKTTYALEGSAFIAGAAVQWLRDGLKIIRSSAEIEALAKTVDSSEGVVFVPALTGLGAPYWRSDVRGILSGLTRGSNGGHIARATLEAIAFQNHDLVDAMQKELRKKIALLKVDGGAAQNDLLMQFQSDILQTRVIRPKHIETTAIGAACLAGIGIGFWKDLSEIKKAWKKEKEFIPKMNSKTQKTHLSQWKKTIKQCLLN